MTSPDPISARESARSDNGEFGTQNHSEPADGTNALPTVAPAISPKDHAVAYAAAVHDTGFMLLASDTDNMTDSEYSAGMAALDAQAAVALANPDLPVSELGKEAGAFSLLLRSQCQSRESMVKAIQHIRKTAEHTVGDKGISHERTEELADHFLEVAYDSLDERGNHAEDSAEYWHTVGRFNAAVAHASTFATKEPNKASRTADLIGPALVQMSKDDKHWRSGIVSGLGPNSTYSELTGDDRW